MTGNIKHITDATWDQEVLQASVPVLVDFWAEWCGPCLALAPTVENIANAYSGRMAVAKLNVDENESTAAKYGIRSIPTLILFKGGEIKEVIIGNRQKTEITQVLDKHL